MATAPSLPGITHPAHTRPADHTPNTTLPPSAQQAAVPGLAPNSTGQPKSLPGNDSPAHECPCPKGPAAVHSSVTPVPPVSCHSRLFSSVEFIPRPLPSLDVTSPFLQADVRGCLPARCAGHTGPSNRRPHLYRVAHMCWGGSRKAPG